jgi:prepilin-type N-terminal cleavage/methylation domain-containing protein
MSALQKIRNMSRAGFTLIELLVVIGILAVLLAIVLVAINPAKQFSQANDTKRQSDVNAILNAVHQYMADNRGTLPGAITTTATEIADDGIDLCAVLVTEYVAALPVDPQNNNGDPIEDTECAAAYSTGYEISRSAGDNRITVSAPSAENGPIQVTR